MKGDGRFSAATLVRATRQTSSEICDVVHARAWPSVVLDRVRDLGDDLVVACVDALASSGIARAAILVRREDHAVDWTFLDGGGDSSPRLVCSVFIAVDGDEDPAFVVHMDAVEVTDLSSAARTRRPSDRVFRMTLVSSVERYARINATFNAPPPSRLPSFLVKLPPFEPTANGTSFRSTGDDF